MGMGDTIEWVHFGVPPELSGGGAINAHYQRASRVFEENGGDFSFALAHCIAYGEVQSTADFFCMGWPTKGDGFFVQMLSGDFKACARLNAERFKFLHFFRGFKSSNRRLHTINLERLNRHG